MKDMGLEMIKYGKVQRQSGFADLVACIARTDKTGLDPVNPRVGWRTDQLLQDIDRLVVGRENDPAAYAEIARQALALLSVGEWAEITTSALLELAELGGELLLPVSAEREQLLDQRQGRLADFIQTLPEGTRRERCCSLLEYHRGVYFNAYGKFALAAEAQARAAIRANSFGDAPGAAVDRFLETVYRLKQALVVGETTGELQVLFSSLEARFAILDEAVRGSALEVQWGEWNGPVHMILACIWLNQQSHDGWDRWSQAALAAAEKLGQADQPLARLVAAMFIKDALQAQTALRAIVDGIGQTDDAKLNEVKATALLLLARQAWSRGDREGAARYFDQMPAQGAGHVQACEVGSS